MKFVPRLICLVSFIFIVSLNAFGGDTPPSWMKQAASVSVPGYDKEVSAVVLHNEESVTLNNDGVLVTTENYAVRILSREGRKHAVATVLYLVSSGKVRDIEGWLIRPDGTTKNYDKKSVLDIISDPDDIYNEYRLKVIDGSDDVDVGFVFGYTVVSEARPLYFQKKWFSQDNLPTLLSRYTLNLPSGWKASGVTFNHSPITPQVSGTSYTWELRNLPFIKREPLSPSVPNIVPWVAINYSPDNNSQANGKAFTNWTEVSRWASNLYDSQVIVDDAVAAKAQELTVNAKTELEKIRAIGGYVQNLQYISIDIGVGDGNGYRPRPSNLVLSRGYGDCKDKANLMRALLRALKIDAYPIAIFSGDPTFVREEWFSPGQFNHCIIAVKISDGTDAPTVIKHATLGRLLIFDATDPDTSLGDLPEYLQGSFALIIAGEQGGLVKMPVTSPESNLLERKIEVNLTAEGEVKGTIHETANGQTSSVFRQELRVLSAPDYKKALEGWLTRGATGAQLLKFTSTDKRADSSFGLDVEFVASRYAQLMQNRLLVFKPVIVGRRNALSLTENTRNSPVMLDSQAMKETAVFTLPTGFVVDEVPDAVNLETPFGKYTTSYEVKDGKLFFTRSMTINRATVPVDKYNSVRDFYAKIRDAEQSPVVLLRK
jgi:transglutaminase-like putative cysteine protease